MPASQAGRRRFESGRPLQRRRGVAAHLQPRVRVEAAGVRAFTASFVYASHGIRCRCSRLGSFLDLATSRLPAEGFLRVLRQGPLPQPRRHVHHGLPVLSSDRGRLATASRRPNAFEEHRYVIASSEAVPAGKSTVRLDFAYDGGGTGKGGPLHQRQESRRGPGVSASHGAVGPRLRRGPRRGRPIRSVARRVPGRAWEQGPISGSSAGALAPRAFRGHAGSASGRAVRPPRTCGARRGPSCGTPPVSRRTGTR